MPSLRNMIPVGLSAVIAMTMLEFLPINSSAHMIVGFAILALALPFLILTCMLLRAMIDWIHPTFFKSKLPAEPIELSTITIEK